MRTNLALVANNADHEPIRVQHGQSKRNTGLTFKQAEFAKCLANGMSMIAAYKQCYDVVTQKDNSIWAAANKLCKMDKVTDAIRTESERIARNTSHDPASLRRSALDAINNVINDPKARHADKLKAAELLGKVNTVQLFSDVSLVKTENVTDEQAKQRLLALLEQLQPTEKVDEVS